MGAERTPAFLGRRTEVRRHPLVPEIRLQLAADVLELWDAAEEPMGRGELEAPFWASAWAGGLALARYLLDHPSLVRGRDVVDVATGSGIVAVAAALAGARSVVACDRDPLAVQAARANARRNGVAVTVGRVDVRDVAAWAGALVTAGDVFYDRSTATAMLAGLTRLGAAGCEVLVGDPYRTFLPLDRLEPLATYEVPVDAAVESVEVKETVVARLGLVQPSGAAT